MLTITTGIDTMEKSGAKVIRFRSFILGGFIKDAEGVL